MSKEATRVPPTMAERRSESILGSNHDSIYTYPLDEISIKPPRSASSSPAHSYAGSSIIEAHDTELNDDCENSNDKDLLSSSPFKAD